MRDFPAQYHLQTNDVLYFSHIPKTAGMTFRTIVEDQFHAEEVCPATLNAQLAEMPAEELDRYRLFRGHLGFINLPSLVPNKKIIDVTVLREPVARVISHYEYIRRMPKDPHYPMVKDMTLAEFSQRLTAGNVGKNIQTFHVAKTLQFELENLSPTEILDLAKQSLDRFAFVGLVEQFQDSLFLLSYIFGWKPIINTRKENAAKVQKSLDEIPADTLAVLKENTALDAELYQYAKEIFQVRLAEMTQNLLEQYGDRGGIDRATPAQSLSDAQYAKLLDLHYQQRFLDQGTSRSNAYAYNFSFPLWGTGWQRRECPQNQPLYRWTGPGTTATLDLPAKIDSETDLLLELCVICHEITPPDILDSLTIEVNQHSIPMDILHDDPGTRYLQGFVPKEILQNGSPFIECCFKVDRVSPLNVNNPADTDTRLVGVALNFVQIFPVKLRRQYSTVVQFFDAEGSMPTIDFLRKHTDLDETIIAPLIFRLELDNPVQDYALFLENNESNWVVVHKGNEQIDAMLVKLALRGFAPVFADEVFIVYSRRKLPKLSYTSAHVKPLYVDRVKHHVRKALKSVYHKTKTPSLPQ